jgi:hypothetical protein
MGTYSSFALFLGSFLTEFFDLTSSSLGFEILDHKPAKSPFSSFFSLDFWFGFGVVGRCEGA